MALKDSMQRPSCFHIKFLITIQALYYVTFQCGSKNIFRKIKKEKNCSQKVEKTSQKSCTLVAVGRVFFLCSPDCPKQPRTSFLFYKFFYSTISGRISGLHFGIVSFLSCLKTAENLSSFLLSEF